MYKLWAKSDRRAAVEHFVQAHPQTRLVVKIYDDAGGCRLETDNFKADILLRSQSELGLRAH